MTLPKISNQPDHFGEQFVVDETGDFLRRERTIVARQFNFELEVKHGKSS